MRINIVQDSEIDRSDASDFTVGSCSSWELVCFKHAWLTVKLELNIVLYSGLGQGGDMETFRWFLFSFALQLVQLPSPFFREAASCGMICVLRNETMLEENMFLDERKILQSVVLATQMPMEILFCLFLPMMHPALF